MTQKPGNNFDLPDTNELELSQNLVAHVRKVIEMSHGKISFSEYMKTVMYEPGLGYYCNGSAKLGADGDFVTAPEISAIFGQCLARQCQQVFEETEQPVILEIGPGSGALACELIEQFRKANCLPARYYLLETSADLKKRQQDLIGQKFPELQNTFIWLEQLPEQSFNGVILANEVLDAIPFDRITYINKQWTEQVVQLTDNNLDWGIRDISNPLTVAIGSCPVLQQGHFDEGYTTEINIRIAPWIKSVASLLNTGLLLLLDYGYGQQEYYHPQRHDGTLVCQYRHRVHIDPFLYPGLQDISASVNFTAVAEAGVASGLQVSGFNTQAHFLINCGLEQILAEADTVESKERALLAHQVRILTMPGEMGEHIKVIALTREQNNNLLGFRQFDQRHQL